MSLQADPNYDLIGVVDTLLPGVLLQREVEDALDAAYVAGGFKPFTAASALAALGTAPAGDVVTTLADLPTLGVAFPVSLPVYPTGLPRFADSNPATDGWCIDNPYDSGTT